MKYSIGLDIGTSSVGWAVINEDKKRIEDVGVRIFERPENPKNGKSLALPRRDARSTRRRIRRRRARLNYLKNFFITHHLLERSEINQLLDPKTRTIDPYLARQKALSEKLSNQDLFIALYHIAKRRGYKSNRKKVEESNKGSESSKVLKAISENKIYLTKYQTVGAALAQDEKFNKNQNARRRNTTSNYTNSFIREDFEAEVKTILSAQGWTSQDISTLMHSPNKNWGGIFDQRPFMTEELMNKMRGYCTFEKDEKRAPKASYTFELFRLVQDLVHLEFNDGQKLSKDQITACIDKCQNTASGLKYKHIKEVIGSKSDPEFKFDSFKGKLEDTKDKNENKVLTKLDFYHKVKNACKDSLNDWERIKSDTELFDQIGLVLTINKDDESVSRALSKFQLNKITTEKLESLSFSKFGHLSIKALRKIIPELMNGQTYDKAVEAAYPGQFVEKRTGNNSLLPSFSEEQRSQLTNPVVKRAISQTRKVVNAIIRKYGAPYQIKIECTNELAKSFKERNKIKKDQDQNATQNEKIVASLKELGITDPTGSQIVKYKLREQQKCKCLYCGKPLGPESFTDHKLAEVDHIIPFSRSGNDSYSNRVLVCSVCNQEKSNMTPFEKWGSDAERWKLISELVIGLNLPFAKRDRILSTNPPKEGWNIHALNDTRFIMKFIQQYIKQNLSFYSESKKQQKVILPTGFITSYLRKMYKLGDKDRESSNLHHAVDACIIATVSQAQIQRFALWNKYKELGANYHTIIDYDQYGNAKQVTVKEYEKLREDLLPWPNFDKEVRIRCGLSFADGKIESLSDFRDKFRNFTTYDVEFLQKIHPLLVSRMPRRRFSGQAHKDTIRSPKVFDGGRRLSFVSINRITIDKLKNSIIASSDKVLYDQLMEILMSGDKNALNRPIYKNNKMFDKNGKPISPVRGIRVYTKESGFLINKGTQFVNNGDTICLNIYRRKLLSGRYRYFAAPLYTHLKNSSKLRILPTPNGCSIEEKVDFNSLRDQNGDIYATLENGFEFVVSIFPNDYIRIIRPDGVIEGYYVKYGVSGGSLSLISHSDVSKKNSDMIHASIGEATEIKKIDISVLGDNYIYHGL